MMRRAMVDRECLSEPGTRWPCGGGIAQNRSAPKMSETFKGEINIDIRDSVPDWSPFEPPKAPDGAPNVVYAVLDDVGFSAMASYGGPIETPNIDRLVEAGGRYTQGHTTALGSPTRSCLLTRRHHPRNRMGGLTQGPRGGPQG